MKNLGNLMKQAQEMQSKMAEMQQKMQEMEISGTSGGGMVQVVINGKGDLRNLTIDKSIIDPEEKEMLEDLIVAAFNDAKAKVEEVMKEQMAEVTGGLKLPPGMNLPF
jgi:DNA-binding YbaB/EbfC family protein